jgi:predicted lipoprotein with Yx(FWY)xxD motif
MRAALIVVAFALVVPASVQAQPADLPIPAATTTQYPPGVKVQQTAQGPVYVDRNGLTLYGMDMRNGLTRWSPDPSKYCQGECAKQWEPLLAPPGAKPNIEFPQGFGAPQRAGAQGARPAGGNAQAPAPTAARPPQGGQQGGDQTLRRAFQYTVPEGYVLPQSAPDWSIIAGPQGPQWVYKGWHMVFVRRGSKPGSTQYDGADDYTWNTLKYIPAVPSVDGPDKVTAKYVGRGHYALADGDGRVLFTGSCKTDCGKWVPFDGGMADRGKGAWTISHDGDEPQWLYRGRPVFVSQEDDTNAVPKGGELLRP